jgi:hypothetical protein
MSYEQGTDTKLFSCGSSPMLINCFFSFAIVSSHETLATASTAFPVSRSLALKEAQLIGGIFITDKILLRCVPPIPAYKLANVDLELISYAFGPDLPDL